MLTHSSTRTRLNVIDTERIDRVYLESPPLHAIFQTFIPTGISYIEEREREREDESRSKIRILDPSRRANKRGSAN